MSDAELDSDDVQQLQDGLQRVREEIRKRIVGQQAVVEQLLTCLLCDGNALLESTPGLGKTLLVRTVADATDLDFSRIQNTPDLMPSDVTGTEIIRGDGDNREFVFERGPVFANLVLADEINRATPKTQAALLEAMQEQQVTVGAKPTSFRSRSSCWRRRTPSTRRGPTSSPKPSPTAFC
ncbi:AAA family ATPase [Haloarculaceae archaeon H-GB2-1]|nr:AAA family ATPase [Haloarculaceae archaeon H-GB2-1]